MIDLPSRQNQIIYAHAGLIVSVIEAIQNRACAAELETVLEHAASKGWIDLVTAIRKILQGIRDHSLFTNLDEQDSTIVEAILRGLHNPASLSVPNERMSPVFAAPGLAQIIYPASKGDKQALQVLNDMSEQMTEIDGDMQMLGNLLQRLVKGERDANKLCTGLSAQCKSLVNCILQELGNLEGFLTLGIIQE